MQRFSYRSKFKRKIHALLSFSYPHSRLTLAERNVCSKGHISKPIAEMFGFLALVFFF